MSKKEERRMRWKKGDKGRDRMKGNGSKDRRKQIKVREKNK